MSAQAHLSPKSPAFMAPGEASRQLWVSLVETLEASGTSPVNPRDHLPLSLLGRCLGSDGYHFVCEAVAVSAHGVKIIGEAGADPGDAIQANFRGLGEIAGVVESNGEGWFVLDIRESPDKLAALAKRFVWCVRRLTEGAAERRMSPRYDQSRRRAVLKTEDGREIPGELLDLSATGAAVRLGATAPYFWVGQKVALDDRPGIVRRHFPEGLGVEFDEAREVETLGAPFAHAATSSH